MNEVTRSGKDYVGYEYKTVTTGSEKVSMYVDAYANFGWTPDDSLPAKQPAIPARPLGNTVTLKLKRDRKILNKAELTRLQQHFEACMDEIAALEKSKTSAGIAYAQAVGLAGTAFMAGSVMAITLLEPVKILLCVMLAVPGIIGWAIPYPLFQHLTKKRTAEVAPLIEQKYDEIHEICEKGNALIH
ncbi:MAG: hypothetical protein FWD39_04685 [Clostridiales bacterium]|nr:hypothetical protein [Clostridiales bacterium]